MKTLFTVPHAHNAGLWIVAASLLLGIAGCATPPPAPPAETQTSEAPNPIHISLEKLNHTVRYSAGSTIPNAAEVAALNRFMLDGDVEHGDEVQLQRSALPIDDRRSARLAASLTRHGLVATIATGTDIPVGEVRLTIDHYVASVPNCPNWSKAPGNDLENMMHSDFGCSTSTNLAAMVVDPRDLVVGRTMGPPVGDPALAAMHRFRIGRTTPIAVDGASSPAPAASPSPVAAAATDASGGPSSGSTAQ